MNSLFIETEAKLFCLLIIGFLYFFQTRHFQNRSNYSMYLFSFAGILLSLSQGFVRISYLQSAFSAISVFCYAVSMFSVCKYLLYTEKIKNTFAKIGIGIFTVAVFCTLSFCHLRLGTNALTYVLVFSLIAIYALDQYDRIRIDNLTRLYNRYGMDAELKEQLRQYEREHSDSFYIIACDLDNFKYINDTWGHLEGDRALILIANALSKVGKMFGAGVFRIGGDEFVIIADTNREGLPDDITSAVKKELDGIDFRDDFDIKMSIGVALYDGTVSVNELLNSADKKLYEAKKQTK